MSGSGTLQAAPIALLCPSNFTVLSTNLSGVGVAYTASATSTNGNSVPVVCNPSSGTVFPIGLTNVVCIASDGNGNSNTCGFAVSVLYGGRTTTNVTPNLTIPDGSAVGVASTLTFSSPIYSISNLQVNLHVAGSFNGDIYAYLTHSSGFAVLLNRAGRTASNSVGYSDDGLNVTFDDRATNGDVHLYRVRLFGNSSNSVVGELTGAWAPDGRTNSPETVLDTNLRSQFLSSFTGLNPNGTWTLYAADLETGDIQTLAGWGLSVDGPVPVPPQILQSPTNTTVIQGSAAQMSVQASGAIPLQYQWRFNGTNLIGATNQTLALGNVQGSQAGNYAAVVSNIYGAATSAVAVLTVRTPPQFVIQPKNQSVVVGQNYTLTASVQGEQPIVYQWFVNGTVLSGRTNVTLTLTNVQFSNAGSYVLTASNLLGLTASAAATILVRATSDPVYATPDGGWNYIFTGDAASGNLTNALDGTWNHSNGSDSWNRDGRGAGVGLPGGVGTTNGILTIEDNVATTTVTFDNRRFYLTHNINADPGMTNASLLLNSGVTLSFRTRLTPPPPTDPLTELTNAPNGWINANDGKGMFGIRQAGSGGGGMMISFSLNLASEDLTPTTSFNFGQAGLHMNNLNGDTRSANVDPGEGGTLNLLPFDPTIFHEFWVTIQDNGAAPGTHRVSIYMDGSYVPTTFDVTGGTGTETPFTNYISLGLPVTTQRGAYDIDYYGYKQGVVAPVRFNEPVGIVLQPTSQTLQELQRATFTVGVTGTPAFGYQWFKNGITLSDGTNASYTTPPLAPADNGSLFTVAVSNACNVITNGVPAVVTVIADTVAPALVSVGSLDGRSIGICFSEAVTATSVLNTANYSINGGAVLVTNIAFRTNNGASAILSVSGLSSSLATPFSVTASGIKDLSLAANTGGGTAAGTVLGLTALDVGNPGVDPVVAGSTFVCSSNSFETVAGGSGLGGTNDGFHFLYMSRSGDFDVALRVSQLDASDRLTSIGLMARESLLPGSRSLMAMVTPNAGSSADGTGPGANQYEADYRDVAGTVPVLWPVGGIQPEVPYPNAWLRLVRQGDFFSALAGSNGVDWVEFAELTNAFPPTISVGVGITSHSNSAAYTAMALFTDLQFAPAPVLVPLPSALVRTNGDAALFSVTATGIGTLRYQWRKNGANLPNATNSTYAIAAVVPADAGSYDVVVSNAGGTTISPTEVLMVRTMDYGDAPAPYPTLLANNGARHILMSNFFLGTGVDFELNGQPDAAASGDDLSGTDDEDGVRFVTTLRAGQPATIEVVASTNGLLNAWIDWNANGDWSDTGDQIFTNQALVSGTNLLIFVTAPGATSSNTFGRFRFSSQAGLSFNGPAPDGEVEDYPVAVIHVADLALSTTASPEPVAVGSNLVYAVTVLNQGPSLATSIALSNALPANVTFVSVTSSQGSCAQAGGAVNCSLGTLAAQNSAIVTITVRPLGAGTITNFAIVTGSELDLSLTNNSRQTLSTVQVAPVITNQPISLIVTQGNTAAFQVTAGGTSPLSYQWQLNGTPITGSNQPALVLANAQTNNAGSYTVRITNLVGAVTSLPATLTVRVPPTVTQQPQSRTNLAGSTAVMSVAASGTLPLNYQWIFNSTNLLSQATNATLTLTNVQKSQSGSYQVSIVNSAGAITSAVAVLTVQEMDFGDAPDPSYPTTLASNGARHLLVPGVYLGSFPAQWDPKLGIHVT